MTWNGYTVFSVLSGAILVVGGLAAPKLSAKDRIFGLIGGAFFLGYGLYVGHQRSGTYAFPIYIFILPPLAVVYALVTVSKSRAITARKAMDGSPQPGTGGVAADRGGPGGSSPQGNAGQGAAAQQSQARRPAAWAPPPPPPGSQPRPIPGDDHQAGS